MSEELKKIEATKEAFKEFGNVISKLIELKKLSIEEKSIGKIEFPNGGFICRNKNSKLNNEEGVEKFSNRVLNTFAEIEAKRKQKFEEKCFNAFDDKFSLNRKSVHEQLNGLFENLKFNPND